MANFLIDGLHLQDIDLVIFDKDGTLFELFPYWSVVANKRAEFICNSLNCQDVKVSELIIKSMGVDLKNQCLNNKGPIGIQNRTYIQNLVFEKLLDLKLSVTKKIIIESFTRTDMFIQNDEILRKILIPVKGLHSFLHSIHPFCKCAIFSYDFTTNLKHIVEIQNISHYFDLLVGGDIIHKPKPDPWGINYISEKLSIPPKKILMIGDSRYDIESALSANCGNSLGVISDITDRNFFLDNRIPLIENFTKIQLEF